MGVDANAYFKMQQMDNYAMSIYKNGRKILSAMAIAGVSTTRVLKMTYHIAKKHQDLIFNLKKAQKAKDAKKIKELKDKLNKVKKVFEKYQQIARIETSNIRELQRNT